MALTRVDQYLLDTEISAEITANAVDVFIYDTSKDSDGGAWRKRTQRTSWYNETLNTATRGGRREFPSVAVIVAQSDKVTIYDGDDPDLPMWMVFSYQSGAGWLTYINVNYNGTAVSSVSALNGMLGIGINNSSYGGFLFGNFVSDFGGALYAGYNELRFNGGISVRNSIYSGILGVTTRQIVNRGVNDVAMTVLPNAPIDSATGLPVPTIAVATAGGISIIKDDGNVINSGDTVSISDIHISKDNRLYYTFTSFSQTREVFGPSSWTSAGFFGSHQLVGTSSYPTLPLNSGNAINVTTGAYGKNAGVFLHDPDPVDTPTDSDNNNGMVDYITSSYNTGWMHGDIKGAFLADTTVESLTANTNLATNATQFDTDRLTSETYDDGDTSWQMVDNAGTANGYLALRLNGLTVGQSYIISMTWDNNATLDATYNHRIDHNSGGSTNFTHWNKTNASSETLTGVFTATSQNGEELVFYANAITLNVSNFIIRAVDDEDRSVNNKGLQVFGTITKSAVATGAELVAYGFDGSNSNYLQQPYNSDLDFGTGDFSIMYWYYQNTSPTNYQDVVSRTSSPLSDGSWTIQHFPSDAVYAYFRVSGSWSSLGNSGSNITHNGWNFIVVTRSGSTSKMYFDGREVSSMTQSATMTNTSAQLKISTRLDNSLYPLENGNGVALVRLSATAPSAEQIKKIYEDEKVLFQENAACTLYGSSDAVTALAYDETTSLLHVGTSFGRSDFQGLRRISNTTTPITTAISAHDRFIVEQ